MFLVRDAATAARCIEIECDTSNVISSKRELLETNSVERKELQETEQHVVVSQVTVSTWLQCF